VPVEMINVFSPNSMTTPACMTLKQQTSAPLFFHHLPDNTCCSALLTINCFAAASIGTSTPRLAFLLN
jgi:hypothetical protein